MNDSDVSIVKFVNSPVSSNSYIIYKKNKSCIVIDPGSKYDDSIEKYLNSNQLNLEYILLTHEHFDHIWGVNNLIKVFPNLKVVCTDLCKDWIQTPMNDFNRLYFGLEEKYSVDKVDYDIEDIDYNLQWEDIDIKFIYTPGHSDKGMCININGNLFTGDTLMKGFKPILQKRYGASIIDLKKSIDLIFSKYSLDTIVYPGHGEKFRLGEVKEFYKEYFKSKGL